MRHHITRERIYEFSFSSLEDVCRVRSVAPWNLKPGYLKLFAWIKDFNPILQRNMTAQVRVRFYGLTQDYLRFKIIFAIASSIRIPICIDAITTKIMFDITFGQYVCVLVDMDLTQTLREKVLVERQWFDFFVELSYDNLLDFCNHYILIEHNIDICKMMKANEDEEENKELQEKGGARTGKAKTTLVQVRNGRKTATSKVENSNNLEPVEELLDKCKQVVVDSTHE